MGKPSKRTPKADAAGKKGKAAPGGAPAAPAKGQETAASLLIRGDIEARFVVPGSVRDYGPGTGQAPVPASIEDDMKGWSLTFFRALESPDQEQLRFLVAFGRRVSAQDPKDLATLATWACLMLTVGHRVTRWRLETVNFTVPMDNGLVQAISFLLPEDFSRMGTLAHERQAILDAQELGWLRPDGHGFIEVTVAGKTRVAEVRREVEGRGKEGEAGEVPGLLGRGEDTSKTVTLREYAKSKGFRGETARQWVDRFEKRVRSAGKVMRPVVAGRKATKGRAAVPRRFSLAYLAALEIEIAEG